MALLIIMISNIFLVQVNSSEWDYTFDSIRKLTKDKILMLINLIMILGIAVITYSPLNSFLKLKALSWQELIAVIAISFASVFWYEIVKLVRRD